MYLAIDIGGTKTLVASFSNIGVKEAEDKFPTPRSYGDFLKQLAQVVDKITIKKFKVAGVAMPATEIDRETGTGTSFSNLPWHNEPLKTSIASIAHCPVVVENDAKLAGLSEASLLGSSYKKVLYVTISTGIGTALIVDKQIDTSIGDAGGAAIMVEHEGKLVSWESFASGKAIVRRFGKRAEDIHDSQTWKIIAHDIAIGLVDIIAMTEPEVVVVGGGVGAYLDRFIKPLKSYLNQFESPLLPIPAIKVAQRPDEAVIYGCFELAKAIYG